MDRLKFYFRILVLSYFICVPAYAFRRSKSQSKVFVIERYDDTLNQFSKTPLALEKV